jgi:hypothetical protein
MIVLLVQMPTAEHALRAERAYELVERRQLKSTSGRAEIARFGAVRRDPA